MTLHEQPMPAEDFFRACRDPGDPFTWLRGDLVKSPEDQPAFLSEAKVPNRLGPDPTAAAPLGCAGATCRRGPASGHSRLYRHVW